MQCYLEIYDINKSNPNWYKTACQASYRLLSNVRVCERIAELLETGGFNDENITKQHLFLINQHKDLGVKMKALSDYYKLKGKYNDGGEGGRQPININIIFNPEQKKQIDNTLEFIFKDGAFVNNDN